MATRAITAPGDGIGRYAPKLGMAQIRTGIAWADETLADLRNG
ncbi:hypothetical protein [Nonomuraea sp. SYSU D8015]|nr:hypothetical protein [Nonomuraea sp. SYSU D8015]